MRKQLLQYYSLIRNATARRVAVAKTVLRTPAIGAGIFLAAGKNHFLLPDIFLLAIDKASVL